MQPSIRVFDLEAKFGVLTFRNSEYPIICRVVLLNQNPSDQELDIAFRELYVAYELLEVAFEDYPYDPDEGLEVRPEVIERIDQSIAEIEAGTAKTFTLEEVAKKFGVKLKCTR